MTYNQINNVIQQYGQIANTGGVQDASPHKLVQMLLNGAIDRIASAKGHMLRGNIPEKTRFINSAINIIGGLRESVNKDRGGDLGQNLFSLYEYMETRLFDANLKNDPTLLDEVTNLIGEIREAWDQIPAEKRTMSYMQAASASMSAMAG
ncbi:flagellar export chaperone FliS [Ectothiorhodospiraceae bacterium BW-2]|nr:flagellar export chaperone FliS [Ectothiorhodospiraceae bacterium BW-2]